MSQFQLLLDMLRWGTAVLFYVTLLFPIVVSFYWPWWKEWLGRNLVSFDFGFLVLAFPAWMNITFGFIVRNNVYTGWTQVAGLYLVIINVIWRAVLIYKIQKRGVRKTQNGEKKNATTGS